MLHGQPLPSAQRSLLLGGSVSQWNGAYANAGCLFPFIDNNGLHHRWLFYGERCPGKDLLATSPNVTNICNIPCPKGVCHCGNTSDYFPAAQWMHAPGQDAVFAESASRWTWPIAAAAAGSFWNYASLSPPMLAERMRAVTSRLAKGGVDVCPFDASGCPGGCTFTSRCGSQYRPSPVVKD